MDNSKFLQHVIHNSVVNLSEFELEILLKSGYDSAYMCQSLSDDESLNELQSFVCESWQEFENKPGNMNAEDFVFGFATKQNFKGMSRYCAEKSLSFFAKTLFRTPRVAK